MGDSTDNYHKSSNKRLFYILFYITLFRYKKVVFGEKDLGLGLHERDFTRFWLNKYNHCCYILGPLEALLLDLW